MSLEELIGYLRNPRDLDLTPYADLLSQTEEMGDPALPSREHTSLLRWVGEAMHHFEQRFPLEEPLASQVRRLKPLAAATALLDPDFLQPDVHPLHQLLDAIQERAVGWQSRLGRAGQLLEEQVTSAIDEALEWFDDDSTDLAGVCAAFLAAAERDQARAQRMSRRVVETETGRVRTNAARRESTRMINAALEKYQAPVEIGQFIKGPWFESAQLLLLKFGADSEQWQQMSATTETLLDSLQSLEDAGEERRQHIFDVVTQLPKEMRRWLLSLHHDTDAVNEAMGTVEYAHLRILRRQPAELQQIAPIPTEKSDERDKPPELVKALAPIEQNNWFEVDIRKKEPVRVQLVFKDNEEQRLLFTNIAGMKVLDHSFEEFDALIENKHVTALPAGGGFSLCLAIAAGVDTTEKLDELYQSLANESPIEEEVESENVEVAIAAAETIEEVVARERAASQARAETAVQAPAGDDLLDDDELQELEALIGDPESNATPAGSAGSDLRENQEQDDSPDSPSVADDLPEAASPNSYFSDSAADAPLAHELDLPMGTWLGFHDGEMPLMAKLAVHDPSDDSYIFVNRQGIKLRELRGGELAELIARGLVDILHTNSSFREDVAAARRELDP